VPHRFNSKCDGCSACVRQCPTKAIFGVFKKSYQVEPELCIDCGVCGMICPVEAVIDQHGRIAERVPRPQRLRPIVDPNMCNGCTMCVDYCPWNCLSVVGGTFAGIAILSEPLACVSCAECVDICIKGAVTMRPCGLADYDVEAETDAKRIVLDTYLVAEDS
jgi:ferredoxin